jgi:Flp pilus assembly protein TadG
MPTHLTPAPGRPTRFDRGSTSLTTVLLTPVFVVIAFMAFQAAMWSHARTEARAVARDSAALVARSHADAADTERAATEILVADTDLRDPAVQIVVTPDLVTATVVGRAPGIIRGSSVAIKVVEVVPFERFRP